MSKGTKIFVRILITLLMLFVVSIITFHFFIFNRSGEIKWGMIVLVLILVVLALSEAFDTFSIGKLFSMKKSISVKEIEINDLKADNQILRNEIISITTSITNSQSTMNFLGGFPNGFFDVQKATEEEVKDKNDEENKACAPNGNSIRRRINIGKLEDYIFSELLTEYNKLNSDNTSFVREVKLEIPYIDPIGDYEPIFDGYIRNLNYESFIEIRPLINNNLTFRDRLYTMLNKIYLYNKMKKANARLIIVLVELDIKEYSHTSPDKLLEWFSPALKNGLLEVSTVKLSEDDIMNNELFK